jgi:ABC-type multidrug transport system ATPase subunit
MNRRQVFIDREERISFYKTFKSIFKDKYVIISTHILDDIEILADYIVMISNGRGGLFRELFGFYTFVGWQIV